MLKRVLLKILAVAALIVVAALTAEFSAQLVVSAIDQEMYHREIKSAEAVKLAAEIHRSNGAQ